MNKIIHFTTVHHRTDTRIRIKEVATLARELDADVQLYVQDGLGDEHDRAANVRIYDTGPSPKGRIARMTQGAWRMYRAVKAARPTVAHFHDPELLPWAILLQFQGVKVIYDVHEDLPRQLLHKSYLPKFIARILGLFANVLEGLAARVLSQLIVVVPTMTARFPEKNTTLVANFPSLQEFPEISEDEGQRVKGRFAYVGAITGVRGISEMVDAMSRVEDENARLRLMGNFVNAGLEDATKQQDGWQRVKFLGWSNRETVVSELSQASAGLVLLHPSPQYLISYPVKMFEYMAAGLPVIASDFPLWREIVENAGCGFVVDPCDPQAIADAMQWIIDNPEDAKIMGQRGRAAVETDYNWEAESTKLLALYRHLLACA